MGENTKVQWTATPRPDGTLAPGHTFNGVRGCAKVYLPAAADGIVPESGCQFCYAESMSKRNPRLLGVWGEEGTRVLASESMWREPIRWNADAVALGERRKVFAYSLGDVFESPQKPENRAACDYARARLFRLIEQTESLDWLLLTKRPENIMHMVPFRWCNVGKWPRNAWVGTSISVQADADLRVPLLLQAPAPVRFLSLEPLLGPVDVSRFLSPDDDGRFVNWLIPGGESGGRHCYLEWIRSLIEQGRTAGCPVFTKQVGSHPEEFVDYDRSDPRAPYFGTPLQVKRAWRALKIKDRKGGDPLEWPEDLRVREFPTVPHA